MSAIRRPEVADPDVVAAGAHGGARPLATLARSRTSTCGALRDAVAAQRGRARGVVVVDRVHRQAGRLHVGAPDAEPAERGEHPVHGRVGVGEGGLEVGPHAASTARSNVSSSGTADGSARAGHHQRPRPRPLDRAGRRGRPGGTALASGAAQQVGAEQREQHHRRGEQAPHAHRHRPPSQCPRRRVLSGWTRRADGRFRGSGSAGEALQRLAVAVDAVPGDHRDGVRGDHRGVPELLGPLAPGRRCAPRPAAPSSWAQAS